MGDSRAFPVVRTISNGLHHATNDIHNSIAPTPTSDVATFSVAPGTPTIAMLGRTNVISDGIQQRFQVVKQFGHKQLIRQASKRDVYLSAGTTGSLPNLCWYSPKGALGNGESARTDLVEMRSATQLLNQQLDAGGDVIITTTKYFSSECLELFLANRRDKDDIKNMYTYRTTGHKIFSTIALPDVVHALRETHREDVMMNAVATFILQTYAVKPPSPRTSQSLPWGKQSSNPSNNSTTTATDSTRSSSQTMSLLLTDDGKPLSKTSTFDALLLTSGHLPTS